MYVYVCTELQCTSKYMYMYAQTTHQFTNIIIVHMYTDVL